jgi:alkylated DNA repair dioxygenase AlkB
MDQLKLFNNNSKPELIMINNGEYSYFPSFFSKAISDNYFNILLNDVLWKQEEMIMYGQAVNFPRKTAWYGQKDKKYTFSGITLNPLPWSESLLSIKTSIEAKCNVKFNSVLLNLYNDGADSISWHTDAEKELGVNPVIASISLGATRAFQLKHKDTHERINLELENGSLLIMQGELQHYWQHQIPKTKKTIGKRINLTFRNIV